MYYYRPHQFTYFGRPDHSVNCMRGYTYTPRPGMPAVVRTIRFLGVTRTDSLFFKYVAMKLAKATTFSQVIYNTHLAREELEGAYSFDRVSAYIDTKYNYGEARNQYEIVFYIEEKKRVNLFLHLCYPDNERTYCFGARFPNLTQCLDRFQAKYSYGPMAALGYSLIYKRPITDPSGEFNAWFTGGFVRVNRNYHMCRMFSKVKGIFLELEFPSFEKLRISHKLKYELIYRELFWRDTEYFKEVSDCTRTPTFKSALTHIFYKDGRDCAVFPTRGSYFRLITELAGFGGKAAFFKNELYAQKNVTFIGEDDAERTIQVNLILGTIQRLFPNSRILPTTDKFFIGGETTIRGFNLYDLGPRDNAVKVNLGGNFMYGLGIHYYSESPIERLATNTRFHSFLSIGNTIMYQKDKSILRNIGNLLKDSRCSGGVGIVLRLSRNLKMEFNVLLPPFRSKGEYFEMGLHYGLGSSFL